MPACKPGVLKGVLTVRWTGGAASEPFLVRVHDIQMKKPRLYVTNWWFADATPLSMLAGHKVEPFSDEYWELIRQFGDFMARYHQNVVLVAALDLVAL